MRELEILTVRARAPRPPVAFISRSRRVTDLGASGAPLIPSTERFIIRAQLSGDTHFSSASPTSPLHALGHPSTVPLPESGGRDPLSAVDGPPPSGPPGSPSSCTAVRRARDLVDSIRDDVRILLHPSWPISPLPVSPSPSSLIYPEPTPPSLLGHSPTGDHPTSAQPALTLAAPHRRPTRL